MIDQRGAQDAPGVRRAQSFLTRFLGDGTAGILTTNYDLLVEYALGTKLFNYGVVGEHLSGRGRNPMAPWQNTPVVLTGNIPLAKMHGSMSWDSSNRYTDGRCCLNGKALIVPPQAGKDGSQLLPEVWDLSSTLMKKTTHLVVFGFAFNPYDAALLEQLSEHGASVKKIHLIDPYPPISRAQQLWPQASITASPPSLETNALVPIEFFP